MNGVGSLSRGKVCVKNVKSWRSVAAVYDRRKTGAHRRCERIARTGCSPPGTGGVAAPVRKRREASEAAQTGCVIMVNVDVVTLSGTDHPVCAFIRRLRSIFLMAQPPLLSEEGNTFPLQFIHTFYDRRRRS